MDKTMIDDDSRSKAVSSLILLARNATDLALKLDDLNTAQIRLDFYLADRKNSHDRLAFQQAYSDIATALDDFNRHIVAAGFEGIDNLYKS